MKNYTAEELENSNYFGFIYITENLTNGMKYVGKCKFDKITRNADKQWQEYLGSSTNDQFRQDLQKHEFKRIIIDVAMDEKSLTQLENKYIRSFKAVSRDDWYNLPTSPRKKSTIETKGFNLRFSSKNPEDVELAEDLDNFVNDTQQIRSDVVKAAIKEYIDKYKNL